MEIRAIGEEVSLEGATVVVGVLAKGSPIPGTEELVDSIDPGLLAANRFEGKAGQLLVAPHQQAAAVLLVGLGEEVSFESLRAAAGNAVRRIKTSRGVSYLGKVSVAGATRAVVEGAVLGAYRYTEYKTANDENGKIEDLEIVGADESEVIEALAGAQATNLARDWVNTPAKDQSPAALAEGISIAAIRTGISVEIWDEQRIADEELGGVIGVAAGSDRPPRVVILRHEPSESVGHLGLVGKGITFDTGGLSIKPAKSMETMKTDMSGGAAVASATIAVAKLGLPVTVTAVIPITDNAVGGDATRPGDVLRPVDGPTIEVLNTDAEGRLILADGLGVIRRYDCDLIVDVATLTGSAVVALGNEIAAVFGSDPDVSDLVLKAASRAGEYFWELPLFEPYRKQLESDIADIKNISGGRYGGAITAALFLSHYAGDVPWAHIDIAGPARSKKTAGDGVKGASGVGVRTLIEIARGIVDSG